MDTLQDAGVSLGTARVDLAPWIAEATLGLPDRDASRMRREVWERYLQGIRAATAHNLEVRCARAQALAALGDPCRARHEWLKSRRLERETRWLERLLDISGRWGGRRQRALDMIAGFATLGVILLAILMLVGVRIPASDVIARMGLAVGVVAVAWVAPWLHRHGRVSTAVVVGYGGMGLATTAWFVSRALRMYPLYQQGGAGVWVALADVSVPWAAVVAAIAMLVYTLYLLRRARERGEAHGSSEG